jgi:hypothetical protein
LRQNRATCARNRNPATRATAIDSDQDSIR